MATLTSQQLKDSYQSLVTIGDSITSDPTSGQLENGLGNPITALGIGTDSPSHALHVNSGSSTDVLKLESDTGVNPTIDFLRGVVDVASINGAFDGLQMNGYQVIRFDTAGTERMRLLSNGDISFRDTSTNDAFYWDASATRLGIGTTSPDAIIETSAGVNGNTVGALLTNTNGAGTADSVSLNFGLGRSADSAIFKIEAIKLLKEQQWTGTPSTINGSLVFSTISNETTAERMRIKSTGDISFRDTGGSEALYWDADVARLGIGETDPDSKLHLKSASAGLLELERTSVGAYRLAISLSDAFSIFDVAGNSDRLVIDSSGNVLVGKNTTSLTTVGVELKADGNLIATRAGTVTSLNREDSDGPIIDLRKDGTTVGLISSVATGKVGFFGSGGTGAVIDSSGNVGIGTSSPRNDANFKTLQIGDSSAAASQLVLDDNDSSGPWRIISNLSLIINDDTDERMRIDASGNILFGGITGLPNGTSIYGSAFRVDSNGRMGLRLATSSSSAQDLAEFYNPNGLVGTIRTDGSATSYNTSSDYRLKENVVEMTGALDRVDQLKPSRFNFIADADTTVDGFLAHEVADVVPEAITGEKDAVDEEGNPIYQGIDQSKLVPLLVGAIQELRAEIEQLKNQ